MVFVKVKTRRSTPFGPPELAVDAARQERLVRGAHPWLSEHSRGVSEARFEVIAWQVEPGANGVVRWRRKHLEEAFQSTDRCLAHMLC